MFHHRASTLRQSHKAHKGSTSKRAVDAGVQGRVNAPKVGPKAVDFAAVGRAARVNHAKQLKETRLQEALMQKRLIGGFGPAKIVAVVPLSQHASAPGAVAQMVAAADCCSTPSTWMHMGSPIVASYIAFRQRLLLLAPPNAGQVYDPAHFPGSTITQPFAFEVAHTLAGVHAADVVVLVVDMRHGVEAAVDKAGELFLAALKATGVPTIVGVVQGLDALPANKVGDARKLATRLFTTEFGEDVKVVEAPNALAPGVCDPASLAHPLRSGAALQLARTLCSATAKPLHWRNNRSYLVAQDVEFVAAEPGAVGGTLKVSGYLRGRPLNVHQLVALPCGGVHQIDRITRAEDPARAQVSGNRVAPGAVPPGVAHAAATIIEALKSVPLDATQAYKPLLSAIGPFAARVRVAPAAAASTGSASGAASGAGDAAATTAAATAAAAGDAGDADVLAVASDEHREPLDTVAMPEGDEGAEQTWPNEADYEGHAHDGKSVGTGASRRRPRGMTAYQAAWLPSDDDTDDYTDVDEDEDEDGLGAIATAEERKHRAERRKARKAEAEDEREKFKARRRRKGLARAADKLPAGYQPSAELDTDDSMPVFKADGDTGVERRVADDAGSDDGMAAEYVDKAEDPAAIAEELAKRKRAAAADEILFPDEMDTPLETPAADRFARFRGMKSFRTSPWDPYESLPASYSQIFTVPHFIRTQNRILAESELAERALHSLQQMSWEDQRAAKKQARASNQAKRASSRRAARSSTGGSVHGGMEEEANDELFMEGDSSDDDMDTDAPATSTHALLSAGGAGGSSVAHSTAVEGRKLGEEQAAFADVLGPGWVASNQYICVHVAGVTLEQIQDACLPGLPLTLFSLLRHENRASVVHYKLMRTDTYTEPIASKETLEFHVGNRVFDARPLFSQGSSAADRNKLERFFHMGGWGVASAFAPITYSPMPVLVYKRVPIEGVPMPEPSELYPAPDRVCNAAAARTRLVLVATGSVLHTDPTRLILKRIVLSGYPLSIKRRHAVVKYMFFNPTDVEYFKPIELYTKHGALGNITEALGTHGHMKCVFDKPIKQHDTVCMALYKRIFPRWGACFASMVRVSGEEAAHAEFARGAELDRASVSSM